MSSLSEDILSDELLEFYQDDDECDQFPQDDDSFFDSQEIDLNLSNRIERKQSFDCLPENRYHEASFKNVVEIKETLNLPSIAMSLLLLKAFRCVKIMIVDQYKAFLITSRWNSNQCLEEYFENKEKALQKLGFVNEISKEPDPTRKFDCLVCYCDYFAHEVTSSGCNHYYCNNCWNYYMTEAIKEGASCLSLTCIDPSCNYLVDESLYQKITSQNDFERYKKFLNASLVVDNPSVKFCPAPECTFVISCERKNRRESVQCKCGFRFCFICCDYDIGEHLPTQCSYVKSWKEKESSESENVKWLRVYTKPCPSCNRPIEKNGGCMHMTCNPNAGGCGHEFCWLCGGPWKNHGSCNKYKLDADKESMKDHKKIMSDLQRYSFFFHRQHSHKNALGMAKKLKADLPKLRKDLSFIFSLPHESTQFLDDATDELLECRKILAWSYVQVYFTNDSQERLLLEHMQVDLERYTEKLTELVERETNLFHMDVERFLLWEKEIESHYHMTKTFRENFVEGVLNGLT